ncbi:hypothetical protein MHYP_G00341530 [Metynnis hypsauchen]
MAVPPQPSAGLAKPVAYMPASIISSQQPMAQAVHVVAAGPGSRHGACGYHLHQLPQWLRPGQHCCRSDWRRLRRPQRHCGRDGASYIHPCRKQSNPGCGSHLSSATRGQQSYTVLQQGSLPLGQHQLPIQPITQNGKHTLPMASVSPNAFALTNPLQILAAQASTSPPVLVNRPPQCGDGGTWPTGT